MSVLLCLVVELDILYFVQRMKATTEVRKALQSKLEEMIQNEEPVKEVSCIIVAVSEKVMRKYKPL